MSTGQEDSALIITPSFRSEDDEVEPGELIWEDQADWKHGGESRAGVSAFMALDELIVWLAQDRAVLTNLRDIVLIGHSAGGQFVQRYALFGRAEQELDMRRFVYLSANPSSYAYLDERRPQPDGSFAVPVEGSCRRYDTWGYGLDELPPYHEETGAAQARARYARREVYYVLGKEDVGHENLATGCRARLQGAHRLERGRAFFESIEAHYGFQPHVKIELDGVGHRSAAVFESRAVREVVFALP